MFTLSFSFSFNTINTLLCINHINSLNKFLKKKISKKTRTIIFILFMKLICYGLNRHTLQ